MPPESRDALKDLAEEAPCQVALGQLQDEVPGVPTEAATGLEQALLVRDQVWVARGRTSRRSRLPRLWAMTRSSSRTSLARNR